MQLFRSVIVFGAILWTLSVKNGFFSLYLDAGQITDRIYIIENSTINKNIFSKKRKPEI